MENVYIDEAGFTGNDFFSDDQLFFVLSSIKISDEKAKKIINLVEQHLTAKKIDFKEIKGKNLVKSVAGREAVFNLLENLDYKILIYDKKYTLMAKFIDWIFEEYSEHSVFYGEGLCRLLVNYLYNKLKDKDKVMERINHILREKELITIFDQEIINSDKYIKKLNEIIEKNKEEITKNIKHMPKWNIDVSSTGLNVLGNLWDEPEKIICDNSKPLNDESEDLEKFVKCKIEFGDSKKTKGIQIADILASGINYLLKTGTRTDLISKAHKTTEYSMIFIEELMEHFPNKRFEELFDKAF